MFASLALGIVLLAVLFVVILGIEEMVSMLNPPKIVLDVTTIALLGLAALFLAYTLGDFAKAFL